MARIFTIQFSHEDETYNTMVSVKTTPLFIEYTLVNLDFELLSLLPGNTIISTSPKTLLFANAKDGDSTALMNTIIKAVSRHLQTVPGLLSSSSDL